MIFMGVTSRSIGVHDGSFHADEVTACALLISFDLADEDKIFRSRDLDILNRCEYVCDVGGLYDPEGKKFDHHQMDYQGDLSSAGMVLKYLKDNKILSDAVYEHLNRSLVYGVDAHDNGRAPSEPGFCSFSNIISNFMPIHYEATEQELNSCFHEALRFSIAHLDRLIRRYTFMQSCRHEVEEAMKRSDEVLIFDKALPWIDIFFELGGEKHPARFVIMPSGKSWKLRGIPPTSFERMKVRQMLPQKWAGLLQEELCKVSKIPGAIFCHKGRFISVWKSKEDALKALEVVLARREV
jgi:uncharacterized UPF0160 family protein